jgi:PAS domain S-box-containing protein
MFPFFLSLRFRLFGLVGLALLPALGFILHHAYEQQKRVVVEAQDEAVRLADLNALHLEQMIGGVRQLVVALAQIAQVKDTPEFQRADFLAKLLKQYPYYHILGVVNMDGSLACSAPPAPPHQPMNFADRPWFKKVVQTRRFFVSDLQTSRVVPGRRDVVFAHPVLNPEDELVGVAGVSLSLKWLGEMAAKANLPPGAVLLVTDRRGNILARSAESVKWAGQPAPGSPLIGTILQQRQGLAQVAGLDGVSRLYAFLPVYRQEGPPEPDVAMYVAVGLPTEMAFAAVNRTLVDNLAVIGLITILISILAWWGGNLLVLKPVQALAGTVAQLASGDLSVRTNLGGGPDELTRLAGAFDRMADSLQRREAERDQAASRVAILNRLYLVRSRINAVMVRTRDPQRLYEQVVGIAVEEGGFRMAWVGEVNQKAHRVMPVAQGGHVDNYLDGIIISTLDVPEGRGPTGTAVREDRMVFLNDWEQDLQMAPWRESGIKRGYRSSAAFPLRLDHQVVAVLSLYAGTPDFFTAEEVALLTALSDDLSFALEAMGQERQRREAEARLKNQMEFVTTLLETMPTPVFYKDAAGRYLGCNLAFEEFFGQPREEIVGKDVYDMGPPEIAGKYAAMDQALFNQPGKQMYEWKVMAADGAEKEVIFNKATFSDASGQVAGLIGVIQDITARKQTEEALRESEGTLRTLINANPEGLFLMDSEGIILAANETIARRLGKDVEELVGSCVYQFLPPDTAARRKTMVAQAVASGAPLIFDDQRGDRFIDNRIHPILDADGKVRRVAVLGIDITARKEAEEALRAASRNWQTTFDAISDGVALLNRESRIVQANRAFLDLVGKEAAEAEGRHCWELVHGTEAPIADCPLVRMWRSRRRETLELAVGERWFLATADPILDEAGEVTSAVHIIADITDSKKAEEAIRESEERFRLAFESANVGMTLVGLDGRHLQVNPALCNMVGFREEELLGMSVQETTHPDDLAVSRDFIQRVMAGEISAGTFEKRHLHKSGRVVWTRVSSALVRNAQGQPQYFISLVEDITARKQAEEELAAIKTRLEKTFAVMGEMVLVTDPATRTITACNQAVQDIFGYRPEEVIGRNTEFLHVHRAAYEEFGRLLFPALDRDGRVAFEFQMKRRDGSLISCEHSVTEILDEAGRRTHLVGIIRDISARRRAEAERDRLFNLSIDMLCIAGFNGFFNQVNPAWSKTLGWTEEELLSKPWLEFVHPEDRQATIAAGERLIAGEAVYAFENRYLCRDGTHRWLSWNSFPLQEEGLIFCVVRDVTERKLAAEALLREKQFSDMAIESLPGVFYLFSADGKYLRWNANLEQVTGYTGADFAGMLPWDLFRGPERERTAAAFQEALQKGEVAIEAELAAKDGGQTPYLFTGRRVEIGGTTCVLGMGIDITARKQAEAALQESEARFRNLFEQASDGFFVINADNHYLDANTQGLAMLGHTRDELLQMNVADVLVPPERPRLEVEPKLMMAGQLHLAEWEHLRKDGSTFWGEVSARRVTDQYYLAIVRDLTERKEAEAALRQSEELYRSLFENMLNGFAYCKMLFENNQPRDFIYLDVNQSFEALTGLKDVVGKKVSEVIPGIRESDPGLLETYGRVALTGQPERFEIYLEALQMWFAISVYSPGKEYFVAVFDVITERKQAEEALRHEKELSDFIINSLPGVFYLYDEQLRFLRVNRKFEEVLGYSAPEIANMSPLDLFEGPDRDLVAQRIEQVFNEGEGEVEAFFVTKERDHIPYYFTGLRTMINGKPHLLGVGIDITARREAEAARRQSEERLRLAVAASGTGLWDWDLRTNRVYFSPEWKRQLGYEDLELPNRFEEWESRLHPEDHDRAVATVQAYIENPWPDYEIEFRLRHKDGSYRWILAKADLYFDETGRPVRMMGSHLDITRRKLMEQELEEASKQLRGLAARLAESEDAERKRLARELHDQVGQNLTVLSINLDIVKGQLPEKTMAPARSRLDTSMALIQQTGRAIRNLMAELRPPVLDDYGLLAALRWHAGEFTAWTGIAVEVEGEELTPRLDPTVENVFFRISQEALTNVAKHAQASRAVVSLEALGDTVRMVIADNGAGFDPKSVGKPKGGHGWGLLSMQERALAVGGRCRIESSPGEGAKVVVEVNR